MEHTFIQKVYYGDTDCYGVVWHGAYVSWIERSRTEFCNRLFDIDQIQQRGIVFPVVELNLRYKSSPKLFDDLKITTILKEIKEPKIIFETTIINQSTNDIAVIAQSILVTTQNGMLNRKLPSKLKETLLQTRI